MTMRIGYHYSDWDYADNETVVRSWDINLTPEQLTAEAIIRDHHPEGPETGLRIRSSAFFLYEDYKTAHRMFERMRTWKYLYTMEYDDADILHRGLLGIYNQVVTAPTEADAIKSAQLYWKGFPPESSHVEVLVSKITVLSRIERPKTVMEAFWDKTEQKKNI